MFKKGFNLFLTLYKAFCNVLVFILKKGIFAMEKFSTQRDNVSNEKRAQLIFLFKENKELYLKEFALSFPGFIMLTQKRCSELTQKEILVCASIKLEIHRDEISKTIFKSNRNSLRNNYYNLGLKLKKDKNVKLEELIRSL